MNILWLVLFALLGITAIRCLSWLLSDVDRRFRKLEEKDGEA